MDANRNHENKGRRFMPLLCAALLVVTAANTAAAESRSRARARAVRQAMRSAPRSGGVRHISSRHVSRSSSHRGFSRRPSSRSSTRSSSSVGHFTRRNNWTTTGSIRRRISATRLPRVTSRSTSRHSDRGPRISSGHRGGTRSSHHDAGSRFSNLHGGRRSSHHGRSGSSRHRFGVSFGGGSGVHVFAGSYRSGHDHHRSVSRHGSRGTGLLHGLTGIGRHRTYSDSGYYGRRSYGFIGGSRYGNYGHHRGSSYSYYRYRRYRRHSIFPHISTYYYSDPYYGSCCYAPAVYASPTYVSPVYTSPTVVYVESEPAYAPTAPVEVVPPAREAESRNDVADGAAALAAGDFAAARRLFARAMLADETDGFARLDYALATFALGEYRAAATAIRDGLGLETDLIDNPFDIRQRFGAADALEKNEQALGDHLTAHPDDADALLVRGYIEYASGRASEAAATLERAVAINPSDTVAVLLRDAAARRAEAPSTPPTAP